MTFVSFFTTVRMLVEEPENRNYGATKKDEQHLDPLIFSFVELLHDDLTAGDVDESPARDPN